MKQSGIDWIGEIPDDWKINQLSQIVSQVKNKNTGLKENNLLSLSYGKIKRKNINTNDGLLPASFDGYNIISDGDIVLRLTDLQNDHTSLRVGRATEQGIITSAYTTLHPVDYDNSKYLYYILHSFDLKKGFYGMGSGVRQGLNYDEVKTLKVPLPPKETQQRIAEYLDSKCAQIDSIIEESKKSIEEYKALKQSVIFEAVTGKNLNCKKKDSGIEWIGEIPEGWEVKRLKFASRNRIQKYTSDYGILNYFALENIESQSGRFIETENEYDISQSLICQKNDVVFGKLRPYLAKVYKVNELCCCSGEFAVFYAFEGCPSFFKYYFLSDGFIKIVDSSTYGTKMPRANIDFIKNMLVAIPPLSEQESIAKMLDSKCAQIDSLIAEKELLITDLTEYKKSLIFEVVTGKRSV